MVLDVASGRRKTVMTYDYPINDAKFRPGDDTKIVIAGADGGLSLFDTLTGNAVYHWPKSDSCTLSVNFSPDGCDVVSSYLDGSVRICRVPKLG